MLYFYSSLFGKPSAHTTARSAKPELTSSIRCRCRSFLYFSGTKRAAPEASKHPVITQWIKNGNYKKSPETSAVCWDAIPGKRG